MTNDNVKRSNVIDLAELREAKRIAEEIAQDQFGDGPWRDEPNAAEWIDVDTGYACMVLRDPNLGHLCGYVGVPNTHRAWAKDYNAVDAVSVHGGLTYSSFRSVRVSGLAGRRRLDVVHPGAPWWFGFDCAHAWDLIPALDVGALKRFKAEWDAEMSEMLERLHQNTIIRDHTYRTFAWVTNEVRDLARQLRELE